MVDERKIIRKLEKRIDGFVKVHPKEKDCAEVQSIKEFIHMLQLEAEYESGSYYGFRELTEEERNARRDTMDMLSKKTGITFDGS